MEPSANNVSCENGAWGPNGDPGDCARSLPPPLRVLSCQGLGGGGVSTSCPHLVLRAVVERSRVLADFPHLGSWVAEGAMEKRGANGKGEGGGGSYWLQQVHLEVGES